MKMNERNDAHMKKEVYEKKATFGLSLLVFVLATAIILVGILVLGLDAHIPVVFAAAVVLLYGMCLHVPYKDLEHAMIKSISESTQVLMIICIIGMLVGTWMAAGTVPYIIYLGLELINPAIFLPFVAIMSTMTGSSWTTASTIGIAFIGISMGLGIPVAITAGAVCCGAFFGDKQSPLSDFCIFASGVSKVDIYKHARRMLWTTAPAFVVSLIIFTVLGMGHSGENMDMSAVTEITGGLAETFKLGLPTLIPVVALIIMLILKVPSVPSLTLAAIIGALTAWLYQGRSYKAYRGMGSVGAMQQGSADRYFQDEAEHQPDKLVPEGIEARVPYKGSVNAIIFQLIGGVRSSMGYCGCESIDQMHEKAAFVEISSAGMRESHVHDVQITKEAPNYRLE
jgi:NhaC family Na+:H+ antiporter